LSFSFPAQYSGGDAAGPTPQDRGLLKNRGACLFNFIEKTGARSLPEKENNLRIKRFA
jgi:hypothetical protein